MLPRFSGYITDRPNDVLPSLVEKILDTHQRAVVWTESLEQAIFFDGWLWTYTKGAFLPHGLRGQDAYPQEHPVWITDRLENPNGSTCLITTHTAWSDFREALGFQRILSILPIEGKYNFPLAARMFRTVQIWTQTPKGWQATPVA